MPGAGEVEVVVPPADERADHLGDAEVEQLARAAGSPTRLVRKTFSGLMSRWTMPFSCAATRPESTCTRMSITSSNGSPPSAADAVGQRLADELLHDEVGAAVVERAEVVHLADVRVADRAGGARLLVEAPHGVLLPRLGRVEHLDGDRAPDGQVLGLEDGAHPALAEHRAHDVLAADGLAEEVARRRRGGGNVDGAAARRGRRGAMGAGSRRRAALGLVAPDGLAPSTGR